MSWHWSNYAPGTGWHYRYRQCLTCGKIWRNNGERRLIHKGGRPRA